MSAPFVNDEKTSTPQQMCSSFLYRQIEDIPGVYSLMDQLKNGVVAMETEDTNSELFSIGGFSIRRGIIVVIISYPQYWHQPFQSKILWSNNIFASIYLINSTF